MNDNNFFRVQNIREEKIGEKEDKILRFLKNYCYAMPPLNFILKGSKFNAVKNFPNILCTKKTVWNYRHIYFKRKNCFSIRDKNQSRHKWAWSQYYKISNHCKLVVSNEFFTALNLCLVPMFNNTESLHLCLVMLYRECQGLWPSQSKILIPNFCLHV